MSADGVMLALTGKFMGKLKNQEPTALKVRSMLASAKLEDLEIEPSKIVAKYQLMITQGQI